MQWNKKEEMCKMTKVEWLSTRFEIANQQKQQQPVIPFVDLRDRIKFYSDDDRFVLCFC